MLGAELSCRVLTSRVEDMDAQYSVQGTEGHGDGHGRTANRTRGAIKLTRDRSSRAASAARLAERGQKGRAAQTHDGFTEDRRGRPGCAGRARRHWRERPAAASARARCSAGKFASEVVAQGQGADHAEEVCEISARPATAATHIARAGSPSAPQSRSSRSCARQRDSSSRDARIDGQEDECRGLHDRRRTGRRQRSLNERASPRERPFVDC